jgi:release factor glutamine methyltransferase
MPQTPAIKDWLANASLQLTTANIPTANLDAELILAHILGQGRTYLHAHPDQQLTPQQINNANSNLKMRLDRVPLAYIIGYKEFYGRDFIVTPFTLIPRPESEAIIDSINIILNSQPLKDQKHIELVDIGTGSGCLGITVKLEFTRLNVTLTDISNEALCVAKDNAQKLSAKVNTLQSNLLQNYLSKPDIIVANLPYVDRDWDRSPETNHEPSLALFADDHGKIIIKTLIIQASNFLSPGGYLIIESDPRQHDSLTNFANEQSFTITAKIGYIIVFRLGY